jgi:hypothetical protein
MSITGSWEQIWKSGKTLLGLKLNGMASRLNFNTWWNASGAEKLQKSQGYKIWCIWDWPLNHVRGYMCYQRDPSKKWWLILEQSIIQTKTKTITQASRIR